MFKFIDVIWGVAVPFDVEKRGLYMIYYGVYIKSVFIGFSRLVEKNQMSFKPRPLKTDMFMKGESTVLVNGAALTKGLQPVIIVF